VPVAVAVAVEVEVLVCPIYNCIYMHYNVIHVYMLYTVHSYMYS